MTRILHGAEALVLLPLALLHCLAIRLDRLLFGPAPVPAPTPAAPLPVAPMDGAQAAEALPSWPLQVVAACSAPSPAAGRQAPSLATMTTVQLRRLAQQQGHRNIGGRRTSKASKAALLEVLA